MDTTATGSEILAAQQEFAAAPADRLATAFRTLAGTLWDGEQLAPATPQVAPDLVDSLGTLPADRRPYLAILLGLLLEVEGPHTSRVRAAVLAGLADQLRLLAGSADDPTLRLALLYLVAHLPEERARIEATTGSLGLDTDDAGRLTRCLARPDLTDPRITRVWPHPAVWAAMPEADREFDRTWMLRFPAVQLGGAWELDTRSLLAYSGAKALWAVEHGRFEPSADVDLDLPDGPGPARTVAQTISEHPGVLRCPTCSTALAPGGAGARCDGCGRDYPADSGYLDLSLGAGDEHEAMTRNVPLVYTPIRSAFLRWKGANWGGAVSVQDEDDYLKQHVSPAGGPVLDLAAGTGRWTAVLRELFGADQVLALDVSIAMLTTIHRGLPDVLGIRGSALALPLADRSIGAVNCWNALQALPDPKAAIAEVGRVLRPGGTFTVMTFRPAEDPLYRYLQTRPFGVVPSSLTTPEQLREWCAAAGLSVRELHTPGCFLFATAVRDA